MTTDLDVLAADALNTYRANVQERLYQLNVDYSPESAVDMIQELTEEYGAYLSALKGARDRQDANYGAFTAFVDAFDVEVSDATELEYACDSFDSAFVGTMSLEDYAHQYINQVFSVPEGLEGYIDYERYARDLELGGDMTENEGHIFHSNW